MEGAGVIAPTLARDFDKAHLWHFRATLLSITDGDTAIVLLDLGCYARFEARIRLAGYSAPETYQPGGPEATARLAAAMATGRGEWPLRIISKQRETVVSQVRSFERLVADVFVVHPDGTLRDVKELL